MWKKVIIVQQWLVALHSLISMITSIVPSQISVTSNISLFGLKLLYLIHFFLSSTFLIFSLIFFSIFLRRWMLEVIGYFILFRCQSCSPCCVRIDISYLLVVLHILCYLSHYSRHFYLIIQYTYSISVNIRLRINSPRYFLDIPISIFQPFFFVCLVNILCLLISNYSVLGTSMSVRRDINEIHKNWNFHSKYWHQ